MLGYHNAIVEVFPLKASDNRCLRVFFQHPLLVRRGCSLVLYLALEKKRARERAHERDRTRTDRQLCPKS